MVSGAVRQAGSVKNWSCVLKEQIHADKRQGQLPTPTKDSGHIVWLHTQLRVTVSRSEWQAQSP